MKIPRKGCHLERREDIKWSIVGQPQVLLKEALKMLHKVKGPLDYMSGGAWHGGKKKLESASAAPVLSEVMPETGELDRCHTTLTLTKSVPGSCGEHWSGNSLCKFISFRLH